MATRRRTLAIKQSLLSGDRNPWPPDRQEIVRRPFPPLDGEGFPLNEEALLDGKIKYAAGLRERLLEIFIVLAKNADCLPIIEESIRHLASTSRYDEYYKTFLTELASPIMRKAPSELIDLLNRLLSKKIGRKIEI